MTAFGCSFPSWINSRIHDRDVSRFEARNFTPVQMEIGAADGDGGNADDDVLRLLNHRGRHDFDPDVMT